MTFNDHEKKALLKGWRRWRGVIEFLAPECAHEIAAIAFRESTWDANCEPRYERAWHERYIRGDSENAKYWLRKVTATGYQEQWFATSWGLMQILGLTAMERGYGGDPEQIQIPEISLLYGTMHFKWLWDKYTSVYDAIAAYNAGSPRRYDATTYVNQDYVDYVLAGLDALRAA